MRIGIFSDSYYPYISGVITSVMTLEKELRALGHEVFVFTLETDCEEVNNNPNIIQFKGITVPMKKLKSFKFSLKLHMKLKKVKEYNLDIIHINTEFTMARLGILASKKLHIPCVYTLHTLYEDYLRYVSATVDKYFHKPLLSGLAKMLVSPINKVAKIKIVPTRKVLTYISKYYIDGDVRVIPTGLDLDDLVNKKVDDSKILELKEKLGINNKFVFVSIGRVSQEKSIDVLLKAYSKVASSNSVLIIVGDGPAKEELEVLAKELGIDQYVKFLGFVEWEYIVSYYQVADVFLNASVTETQGLTYLESLAVGTPILVKRDDCLIDILKENVNGFYFDTVEDLSNYMSKLISKDIDISHIKNNTFDTIKQYSKEQFAKSILNVYEDAIKKQKDKKPGFFTKSY